MRCAVLLLLSALLAASQQPASLVIRNARVWTANPAQPWAEAVAIREGRIVGVGSNGDIDARGATRVIDAGGKLLLPGFIDAHVHFASGSLGLSLVDLTGACTLESIQKRIAVWAAEHPNEPWITGGGWEYNCFPGHRLPTRADLDAVTGDRPAFLRAYDGHTAWANTKAFAIAGITASTRYEGFGELVREPETGLPAGALKEGAMSLISRHLPAITDERRLQALRQGLRLAASLGITSLHNASGTPQEVSLYERLLAENALTARLLFALSAGTNPDPCPQWRELAQRLRGPMIRISAVKFLLDGVIESHTAAMLDPYSDDPSTRGSLALDADAYRNAVAACAALGFQPWTHAIGDAAVRAALDAYAPLRDQHIRPRIEHIETVHIDDLPRFRELGVVASMEPIHAYPSTINVWSKAVGERRLPLSFAWRSLQKAGAPLAFSSDWPASISLSPIRGIHNAVNRQTIEGEPAGGWLPEQRVDLETALRAYTIGAAWAARVEEEVGSITPGKRADLILLDKNLFAIPPAEIHSARVELTVFDGRVIYPEAEMP